MTKQQRLLMSVMPRVIFGTSALGNLYVALSEDEKTEIIRECLIHSAKPVVFDTAGKYGAGLALETLGKTLTALNVSKNDVLISNKLGWIRTSLKGAEPTFEPGVWKDLQYDAVQNISYDGILECFEQGNKLLNGYNAQLVSVHDADEYLAKATSEEEADKLYQDILDAYEALFDLKRQGKAKAVGIGAKDWTIIRRISKDIAFDWVMFANSFTIKEHPEELIEFMQQLKDNDTMIINSAVFHGGFLTGSDYYNYKPVSADDAAHAPLYAWRDQFYKLCDEFNIKPAEACVQFGLSAPGVVSVALNTSNAKRVKDNVHIANKEIPAAFWEKMKVLGLIRRAYSF